MRLFWKIFSATFIPLTIIVLLVSVQNYINAVKYVRDTIIEKNIVAGEIVSKEVEMGYSESRWPFETLKKISEDKGFLFWWIVRDNGVIYLADNVSFIGTNAHEYFSEIKYLSVSGDIFMNDKQNYGIFIKPIKTIGKEWSFWSGFSTNDIVMVKKSIILSTIASFILSILTLVVLLYFATKGITKPIYSLAEGTREISQGNLGYQLRISSEDEIGQLASSFNKMTAELKNSRKELENYNKELERKVRERTRELKDKNKELEGFNKFAVERELKMIELKKRIEETKKRGESA